MKRKLLLAACLVAGALGFEANAQASYNKTYTQGVEVAAGSDYFLYNIGAGQFLTGGMDWGSHASADHAGKTVTLAVSDGGYTIYTAYYSPNGVENSGFLTGGDVYTDNDGTAKATYSFNSATVDGYTNVYTLTTGGQYLFYDTSNTKVNLRDADSDNYSKWLLIPKNSRDAVGDYTYYLQNTGINRPWERQVWCGYDWQQNNRGEWKNWEHNGWSNHPYYTVGGADSNPCGEKFHQVFDFYQTISQSLPEGRYRLNAQAFWRDGSAGETYLYMSDAQQPLVQLNANGENTEENMAGASTAFSAGQYANSVEKFLGESTANVRIGINMTTANQWVIFDNFALDYLGQCVMDYAVALPETGAMEANKWYYFDVAIAADNYLATATTLSDIICTTDGYTLTSATAGDVILSAENNSLSAIRYYVKSSSANNLVISVASYSYTINEATISADYVQPGNTVTVKFSTTTNDPNPELIQDYTGVTFNGSAINTTPTESGFAFTVPEVSVASTYTLSIPAGAIKYNENNKNAAQNFTLNTPAVFDGTYYLYNPFTENFLGRGANYGTAAVVDKYGIPFKLETGSDGYSTIQFVDNNRYLFNSYWLLADGSVGDNFRIAAQTVGSYTGYAFYNKNAELGTNNRMYVYVNDNGDNYRVAGNAIIGDNCTNEEQTVWQIQTVEEHNAIVNAYPVQNIQNVITNAGISTTTDDFSTFLSENYIETDMTSLIGTATFGSDAGDWTWTEVRGENTYPKYTDGIARLYQATGSYTQTIASENLPAGIYKVTMGGFDRRAAEDTDRTLAAAYGSVSSSYLKANNEQVRIMSWVESCNNYGSETTTWATQAACVNEGKAKNELYVYLDGSTPLELTVAKTNFCSLSYMVFSNFTLTRYDEQASANMKIAAGKYATFCAPFDVTIPEGVTAYTVDDIDTDGTTLVTTEVTTTISANTPVLLYSASKDVDETFYDKRVDGTPVNPTAGLLTGVYTKAYIPEGVYVLQTQGEGEAKVQAFYKVESSLDIEGVPNRAYLDLTNEPNTETKARVLFVEKEDATVIAVVSALISCEVDAIYSVNGTPLNGLQKGINIVKMRNGETKKVLVK